MKAPLSLVVTAAMWVITVAPVMAGGAHQPRIQTHHDTAAQAPRHGQPPRPSQPVTQGLRQQATNPGMTSFHQPSYSIDRKDWWLPHPYFQPNSQSFGYPTRPVARPHAGYWVQERQR
jgi:hypothetical protein